jgi:hypothetical protein
MLEILFKVIITSNERKSVNNAYLVWRWAPQQMLRTHRSLEAYCATLR